MSSSLASIFTDFKIDRYSITYEPLGKGNSSTVFPVALKGRTGRVMLVLKIYHKADDKEREVKMLNFISNSIVDTVATEPLAEKLYD